MPRWPVYIVRDGPPSLSFTVAVDDRRLAASRDLAVSQEWAA
jgi:hypothetical protein